MIHQKTFKWVEVKLDMIELLVLIKVGNFTTVPLKIFSTDNITSSGSN